jgi:hypothetical protein
VVAPCEQDFPVSINSNATKKDWRLIIIIYRLKKFKRTTIIVDVESNPCDSFHTAPVYTIIPTHSLNVYVLFIVVMWNQKLLSYYYYYYYYFTVNNLQ